MRPNSNQLIKPKAPTSSNNSNRLDFFSIGIVVGPFLDLLLMNKISKSIFLLMPPVLIAIGFCIDKTLANRYIKSDRYKKDLAIQKNYQKDTDDYNRRLSEIIDSNKIKYEVPRNTSDYKVITYFRGHPKLCNQLSYMVWIKDSNWNLVDSNLGLTCEGGVKIPLDNIKSFTRKGDIRTETRISGGGGGGSSIKGAVIGEMLAGPAGAIIGSRKKNDAIKTENVVIDERQTIMEIEQHDERRFLFFDSKAYDVFLQMIPEKEISFVISTHGANAASPITTSLT